MADVKLSGWRVLVPRAGELGDRLAAAVVDQGGTPVISPLIKFRGPSDESVVVDAYERLASGTFDWLVVTSATTVGELARMRVSVPAETRIAATGEATRQALESAGYVVHLTPRYQQSALGLIADWRSEPARILLPQSAVASATLAEGLRRLDNEVETVEAYQTVAVTVAAAVADQVATGKIHALLITSGSIAREVRRQLSPLPSGVVIACIGESSAATARDEGLSVQVVAAVSSARGLVKALASYASH